MNQKQPSSLILAVSRRLWPELADMPPDRRAIGIGEVFTTLYALPPGIAGMAWLFTETKWHLFREESWFFVLLACLLILFNQFRFFFQIQLPGSGFGRIEGSFSPLLEWTGFLLLGPTAIWLPAVWAGLVFAWKSRNAATLVGRWGVLREFSLNFTGSSLVPLCSLLLIERLGGEFPLRDLSRESLQPVFLAFLFHLVLTVLLHAGYALYHLRILHEHSPEESGKPMLTLYALGLGSIYLVIPFATLAVGFYQQSGLLALLFFLSGLFLVSLLAWQLSHATEQSRLQTRILERLESIGRSILNAPLSGEALPEILSHELVEMFPPGRLMVWIFPDEVLYQHPEAWKVDLEAQLSWWMKQQDVLSISPGEPIPWVPVEATQPLLLCPILDVERQEAFGAIQLELYSMGRPWPVRTTLQIGRGLQSLASVIASAYHQRQSYQHSLALQRMTHELELAGEIQFSFLDYDLPKLEGWQVAFALDPAGETFGDFFDIIPLPDGRVGFVIADVADKGIGPALYMALARTLIRTYALEFDPHPEKVFQLTNRRILQDSHAGLFVTVFYGVLDPATGNLHYANAGHNPPLLYRPGEQVIIRDFIRTGIPVGVDPEAAWASRETRIHPGDVLVLYTDGVTDALNSQGEFYSQRRLVDEVKTNLGLSAEVILGNVLASIRDFVDSSPQFDDITLMVLLRDPPSAGH